MLLSVVEVKAGVQKLALDCMSLSVALAPALTVFGCKD